MDIVSVFNHFFSFLGLLYFICGTVIGFCFFSGKISEDSSERGDSFFITKIKIAGVSIGIGILINLCQAIATI